MAGALRWARTEDRRQQRVLRALLCLLCLLTLVVLASALHRLGLYEQAFGFTRTRLAVHALLLFGGALFVLVLVALASDRRGWLAQATVLLAAFASLAFWVSDPDRRIAAHNVERYAATGRIDTELPRAAERRRGARARCGCRRRCASARSLASARGSPASPMVSPARTSRGHAPATL